MTLEQDSISYFTHLVYSSTISFKCLFDKKRAIDYMTVTSRPLCKAIAWNTFKSDSRTHECLGREEIQNAK